MSIHRSAAGTIVLQDRCALAEAEELLRLLLAEPGAGVDWSQCSAAHSAVIQVLLAVRPPLRGTPADPGLTQWLVPLLQDKVA